MNDFLIEASPNDFSEVFKKGWITVTVNFGDRKITLYAETDDDVTEDNGQFLYYVQGEIDGDARNKVWGDRATDKRCEAIDRKQAKRIIRNASLSEASYYVCPECDGIHANPGYAFCPWCGQKFKKITVRVSQRK